MVIRLLPWGGVVILGYVHFPISLVPGRTLTFRILPELQNQTIPASIAISRIAMVDNRTARCVRMFIIIYVENRLLDVHHT